MWIGTALGVRIVGWRKPLESRRWGLDPRAATQWLGGLGILSFVNCKMKTILIVSWVAENIRWADASEFPGIECSTWHLLTGITPRTLTSWFPVQGVHATPSLGQPNWGDHELVQQIERAWGGPAPGANFPVVRRVVSNTGLLQLVPSLLFQTLIWHLRCFSSLILSLQLFL